MTGRFYGIKRFLISLTIFALIVCQFSARLCAHPQRRGIPIPEETFLPKNDVEIEMHRFNRLPMIELMINDTGPYRMIVDTGAAGLVVTPELAEKLELPSPPGMPPGVQVQVRTPGGAVPATLNFVDKVVIGDASFKGVWAIATELPFGDGMDGVVGMNVFNKCLLTYDYPKNRIVLSKGELPKPNGSDVLAYTTPRMPDSHPLIQLSIDGQKEQALIDTGMKGWFGIPKSAVEELNVIQGPVVAGMGLSVGKSRESKVARIKASLEIGENLVKDPIVRLIGEDYMVGTLFLENFVVTFDGNNKRVRLTRSAKKPLQQPAWRDLGFGLKRDGHQMVIWYVHPESHAAKLDLEVNDVVLEINGKPAVEVYETRELLDAIQTEASIPVRFKSKDGNKTNTVKVNVLEVISTNAKDKSGSTRNQKTSLDAETLKIGKAAFKQGMCAKCHGQDGTGSKRGPNLTDSRWDHCDGSAAGIEQVLNSGVAKEDLQDASHPFAMNPATNLVKDKSALAALARYVQSLAK